MAIATVVLRVTNFLVNLEPMTAAINDVDAPLGVYLDGGRPPQQLFNVGRFLSGLLLVSLDGGFQVCTAALLGLFGVCGKIFLSPARVNRVSAQDC